ncbi:type IV secretion system VirB5 domain-containing protein (plasmid) [Rhizobium etli 8C-3]|uniref:Type IV secretion system VirB5 domain-containing protein n=1 Tax=Rhizobium etli 8C-3 TaxID=538025 RepID=A0A1L5PAK5_RHIET|nr:type IV secretion system protein [Rhizobium etli]APO77140.1 type IV secretion system VirB5 domain-containing protein [Rhizobium etli 8C-3]
MTRFLKIAMLCSVACTTAALWTARPANAQSIIDPLLDPIIGGVPNKPDEATESYDKGAITQLMKIVELTKVLGGGITQLVETVMKQTVALDSIRDAHIGRRDIPLHNTEEDVLAREGGTGLLEMATSALDGAVDAPEGVKAALTEFRTNYKLDDVFELKDDKAVSLGFAARASAHGAIAASTAEESYKRANESMTRISGYLETLENSNDLKTSVDLNTRVMIEMTQQLNESLRTQAAIASVAGTYYMILGAEVGGKDGWSNLVNFNR